MSGPFAAAVRLAAFILFTLPLMPLQWLFLLLWPGMARRFPMHYHRWVARILGVRVAVLGTPPAHGPCLLVSNHVSWLDIVVLSSLAPLSFVAKQEVAGWPFFGTLARLQRTLFVNRERRHHTGQHRDEIAERLLAGDILVLFPEGTSGDGACVLPFKSSFFAAAAAEHIAVQPVTVAYSHGWNLPLTRRHRPRFAWYGGMELAPHLWQALAGMPLTVQVQFHTPLDATVSADRKAACAAAHALVKAGLYEALHRNPHLG